MSTPLEDARDRLQRAVRRGSYQEAGRLLEEYSRAVRAALVSTALDSGPPAATLRSALDVLRWADRVVRAGRAHDAARLAKLGASRTYRPARPARAATWELEG
ncbi:MAG: hypothetical protein IT159_10835 [Bryobacterales bacterium]|nr:hypothetical protein [Bryobacterales bacterium]